jgi:outer membrane lipoprotein-sorting protein
MYRGSLFFLFIFLMQGVPAQDANILIGKIKQKLNSVNDYQATGVLKTGVSFMKVPDSKVTVYYKSPDKFRISKPEGISVVPKGGVSINFNALLSGSAYTAVNSGKGTVAGNPVSIVKLIPLDEKSEVMISTLYIDEKELLIRKASTTTKDNGTYEMEMSYGKFAVWGLPDKVIFTFNTSDYKLPKGVTFDYDTGDKPAAKKGNGQKGTLEISYSDYMINKGIPESVFK